MASSNDRDVLSISDGVDKVDNSLNQPAIHDNSIHSVRKQSEWANDMSMWRTHAFNVILPRNLSDHTDSDLKLMRVSLMNAISVSMVHLLKVERELKNRGCNPRILV
ncbi:MAG: hypothetical protein ACFFFD_15170 [Promethearchaeota archaeon]